MEAHQAGGQDLAEFGQAFGGFQSISVKGARVVHARYQPKAILGQAVGQADLPYAARRL